MGFKLRKRVRIGPVVLIFTEKGFSSWGIKIGPYSWNARTRRSSFDTPGPGSYQWGGRNHRR